VELCLAAVVTLAAIEHLVDVHSLIAALVFVEAFVTLFNLRRLRVISAVTHLSDGVVLLAAVTTNKVQVGPNLPIDLFPADPEGFSNEGNKLFKIPVPVDYVLRPHLTVSVNTLEAISARQNLPLFLREELRAVGTLM